MKYTELLQLKDFFKQFKKIDFIKRIDDNVLELSLNKQKFIFDMSRGMSAIYTATLTNKTYNAPFDFMLKKYFSNALINTIEVLENNRILCFHTKTDKAYKSYENKIYFEFTGKNTNIILTDQNELILEALRHIDKSYRIVKPNVVLEKLSPFQIDEKFEKIQNFETYFQTQFQKLYLKNLDQCKKAKQIQINKKIENIKNHIQDLEKEENLLSLAHDLSKKADLLFAHLNQLHDYDRDFTLIDFDGNKQSFKLEFSPKQSANLFYKNAKKAKQKAKNINIQRQNLQEKLDFLLQLEKLIFKAQTIFELEILFPKKNKNHSKEQEKDHAVAYFYFNSFKICIGKNEQANIYLLKNSKKDDLWLHVKDRPSSHVIIVSNKQKISLDVIEFAAKLCVNFSNLNQGTYLVDYTNRNFVKIKEKAFVNYTNFKSISVVKD